MIIEQNTELKAMNLLARCWYKRFSVYEIAKNAKISVPMAYNAVKKLEAKKVVIIEEKKVRLNLNNPFSYAFKMMHDSERLLQISEEDQNKISHVFNVFVKGYGGDLLSFMVFGSAASNEQTEKSDIDLLAVVRKKKEIDYRKKGLLNLGNLNIIEKGKNEFENDYFLANDLVLNALMNGIVLYDSGIVRFLLTKPLPEPSYDVIMQKKERLDILKNRLFALLKDENYKELAEQLKLFIIEKARILFLQKGIIPSSKRYIVDNLSKIDKQMRRDYLKVSEKNAKEILLKNV